jgi:probable HAF family extracellular repeat protein
VPLYQINEILPISPGHDRTIATGINDIGQVVGTSLSSSGGYDAPPTRAFMWQAGTAINLGDLPGEPDFSFARSINNAGWIVGSSGQSGIENAPYSTHPFERAFVWHDGIMENLGYPPGFGASHTQAIAINNAGQVIGNVPFIWQNGVTSGLHDLSSNGLIVTVTDINDDGQIVGFGKQGETAVSGVIIQGSAVTFVDNLPDDPHPGAGLRFLANNDMGQVVGQRSSQAGFQLFIYSDGIITDVGIDLGVGDINNSGQLVGSFDKEGISTGYLYENGVLYDLNDLILDANWHVIEALDINNSGLIVGRGIDPQGYDRAFVLTPLTPLPNTAILEPQTYTLLLIGVATMGLVTRRKV